MDRGGLDEPPLMLFVRPSGSFCLNAPCPQAKTGCLSPHRYDSLPIPDQLVERLSAMVPSVLESDGHVHMLPRRVRLRGPERYRTPSLHFGIPLPNRSGRLRCRGFLSAVFTRVSRGIQFSGRGYQTPGKVEQASFGRRKGDRSAFFRPKDGGSTMPGLLQARQEN